MGFFSRKSDPSIPSAAELEAFGRYSFSPMDASEELTAQALRTEPTYYASASGDPAYFSQRLRALAESDGEWVAVGANRLIASLLGGDFANSDFDIIRSIALNFFRSRGISHRHLTGYETTWWGTHNSPGEAWLTGRPAPPESENPVTALGPGESRHVAVVGFAESLSDVVVQASDNEVTAYNVSRESDDDPPVVWLTTPTLYDLYVRLGHAILTPPLWCDSELAEFIPLPQPDIS